MPRAVEPGQAEVLIRPGDGSEMWATSFVVLWHDQFGTRQALAQHTISDDNPDSDLLDALSFGVGRQFVESDEEDAA